MAGVTQVICTYAGKNPTLRQGIQAGILSRLRMWVKTPV